MSVMTTGKVPGVTTLDQARKACQITAAGLSCREIPSRGVRGKAGLEISADGYRLTVYESQKVGEPLDARYDSDYSGKAQKLLQKLATWSQYASDKEQLEKAGYIVTESVNQWGNPSLEFETQEEAPQTQEAY
jgi:hypothetical protein